MSKYITFLILLSFSVTASDERLPLSINLEFPHSSRTIQVNFNPKSISYVVFDNGQSKTDKKIDDAIHAEIVKKWDEILPALKKASNDFVCVNSIKWTIELSAKEKKVICKDKVVTAKLGDFQQAIQMLMIQ